MDFFVVVLIIFIGLMILIYRQNQKEWEKYSNEYGIMDKKAKTMYAYYIPHPKEEVLRRLANKNSGDRLCYEVQAGNKAIRFTNPSFSDMHYKDLGIKYIMNFSEEKDACLLRLDLSGNRKAMMSSKVPMLMDAFWVRKVDAVPCATKETTEGQRK